jgi:hypothetical protein
MTQPASQSVHIERALSDLSVGYRQDKPSVAERIFPRVPVEFQSDKFHVWKKEDLWRRNVQKRAPGTKFARSGIGLTTDSYQSEQYALEYPIPDEDIKNADAVLNLGTTATNWLYDQLMLEQDYQFAAQWMITGVGWGVGSLGAGKWSAANSTPTTDVQAAVRTVRRGIGASMNHKIVAVCGTIVEQRLLSNSEIVNKLVYTQVGTIDAIRGALANILGLDELIVADREYNTAAEGRAASYSPVFDDDILIVARPNSPGPDTPAAGYSFAWDEDGKGDMYIESYRDETIKSDIYRGICYYDLKQVAASLGVLFTDCVD